jgi:maltooligosyltrehalose trehalohydrolase
MNLEDVSRRTIGVNFKNGQAEICVWAPLKESVAVKLEGGKQVPLTKDEFGFWKATTNEIKPGDLYKVVIDDDKELPDPASVSQPEGVHGHSQALDVTSFNWTDNQWKNHQLKDYIFYELHTGTFTPQGTFAAIEEKLDYLVELGITAIEIMPVAQFPGSRNWGYDGVFPYAVQDSYGGAKGLQHLVNACHQKGIAVVLDVVYNHMGPEGNYLGEFGPYFTSKYNTPWGNAINFDDEYCDGVRQYFIENVLMWFRDFHVDALRMDAVHAIKDFSAVHILREIKMHVHDLVQETGRQHHLIVELDLNDTRFINPVEQQGFGMDAQWVDEFHHALRVAAGEPQTGYYSDFSGISHLAKSYKDAYVFDGQYSLHRKKHFGIKAENNPGQQFIVFSQNHDQVGNRMLGERTSALLSFEMQKLMAAAVIVSPYLPMLFMGEEYGELHPFQYFVSHTDKELAEAVRKGRKAEFAAFHAEGEAPDPVSEETFNQSKLQWDLLNDEPHKTMFHYYQALIDLRKHELSLKHLERHQLDAQANESDNTLLLRRWYEDEHVLCLMNFSKEQQQMQLPLDGNEWMKIFDSAEPRWKGPKAAEETVTNGATITLQSESILIYSNQTSIQNV